ncbi:MAG: chorismate-binding protein [Ignavibacteriaceae bacterium]|nr:chorismate-binding protein [Ignavibacteriaceae bacterium]
MIFTKEEAYSGSQTCLIKEKLIEILGRTEFQVSRKNFILNDSAAIEEIDRNADFIYRDVASGSVIMAYGKILVLRNFSPAELSEIFSSFGEELLPVEMRSLPLFLGIASFDNASGDPYWKDLPESEWFIPARFVIMSENKKTEVTMRISGGNGVSEVSVAEYVNPVSAEELFFPENEFAGWAEKVEYIKEEITKGSVSKVVLARRITGVLPHPSDPAEIFAEMSMENPGDTGYFYRSGSAAFMGVTPEKLLTVTRGKIYTEAIAGSIKRNGVYNEQEMSEVLSTSEKDLDEHFLVRDFLIENLQPFSQEIQFDKSPTVKKLKNLFHLKTMISGRMKHPELSSVLQLVSRIFPTPAVCGTPKEKAAEIIHQIETAPRGYYAGIMGYFTLNGDCDLAVTIRSILMRGNVFAAYAGCGIVRNSNPELEFEESTVKLKTATAPLLYANQS